MDTFSRSSGLAPAGSPHPPAGPPHRPPRHLSRRALHARHRASSFGRLVMAGLLALVLTGCGMSIPADPDGTLERVSGGELRVGVSHSPPWTDLSTDDQPTGVEPELVQDFAAAHDAEVVWETGGEEHLMTLLDEGRIDMVIGGLTDSSPWTSHSALTSSYAEAIRPDGSTEKHVMAVRTGENAFMVALERHALAQEIGMVQP